jgi:hypothetical protein
MEMERWLLCGAAAAALVGRKPWKEDDWVSRNEVFGLVEREEVRVAVTDAIDDGWGKKNWAIRFRLR